MGLNAGLITLDTNAPGMGYHQVTGFDAEQYHGQGWTIEGGVTQCITSSEVNEIRATGKWISKGRSGIQYLRKVGDPRNMEHRFTALVEAAVDVEWTKAGADDTRETDDSD